MNARTESWGNTPKGDSGFSESAVGIRDARIRRVANVLAALAVLLVLCLTLFPFDFTASNYQLRFSKLLHPTFDNTDIDGLWDDVVVNVLLFIPLGYAFAVLIRRQSVEVLKPMLRVSAMGLLLSLTIEFLQVFLPFRFPSLFDVASNTIGAACGFVLHRIVGGRISVSIANAFEDRTKARRWISIAYVISVVVVLGLVAALDHAMQMAALNKTWPLSFGNEPSGARPWNGRIEQFILAKRAIDARDVATAFERQQLPFTDNQTIIASYSFVGKQPYVSRTFYNADLELKGNVITPTDTNGFTTNSTQWLESKLAGLIVSSYLMEKSQFTMLITLDASLQQAEQNARIVAIAGDPTKQNFTVAQMHDDLALRFRTMVTGVNGTTPQFVVKDVFTDSLRKTIIATFDSEQLRVYVGNTHRVHSAMLGPGFAFFSRLFPWQRNFELSSFAARTCEPLFRVLIFFSLGVLLGLALRFRTNITTIVAVLVGSIVPPLLVELLLAIQHHRDINVEFVFIGVLVIASTIAIFTLWQLRNRRATLTPQLRFDSTEVVHHHSTTV